MKRCIATYEKKYKFKLEAGAAWKSIPITTISPCAPWACPAWARWASPSATSHRHGQPLRPPARRVPLGLHPVARNEPRLHPHHDQFPRAALVHRRHRGARRDRRLSRMGRPPGPRRDHGHQGTKAAAHRRSGPRLHPSARSRAGHGQLLPGRPHLRLHHRKMGLGHHPRHDQRLRARPKTLRRDPQGTEDRARPNSTSSSWPRWRPTPKRRSSTSPSGRTA